MDDLLIVLAVFFVIQLVVFTAFSWRIKELEDRFSDFDRHNLSLQEELAHYQVNAIIMAIPEEWGKLKDKTEDARIFHLTHHLGFSYGGAREASRIIDRFYEGLKDG